MTRVEVPALCEFEHEGRSYVRGEIVACSPVQASILARRGLVSLTRVRQRVAVKPASRYRRRDMRAEG